MESFKTGKVSTKTLAVTMRDNITLFLKEIAVLEPKGIVIIVHGVCEHNERYDYVTRSLNMAGFSVFRFDLRGHGKSGGDRGYAKTFREFSDDLNEVVTYVKKDYSNLPLFILGHSMGAFICALFEILYPKSADGYILSGIPATELPLSDIKLLKKLPYNKFPKLMAKNKLAKLVSRDKRIVEDYINDPLNLKKSTIKMSAEMFLNGPEYLAGNISGFKSPCLILHGSDDKIVTEKASEWFFESIFSSDKMRKVYPGLYHEILNEPEKDMVIHDIINWLGLKLVSN